MEEQDRIGRIEQKLDRMLEKVTELGVRNELVGILEKRVEGMTGRIAELESFKLKLVGAAIGVGFLAGSTPHIIAAFVRPTAQVVEHASNGAHE